MRKHKSDSLILILMLALMGVGLIVIYTIGPVRANFLNAAYGASYSESYFFVRQLLSVGLALVAFALCYKCKYDKMRKYVRIFMMLALASCVVLALAQWWHLPIARCELGACRWFNLAGVSLQPAEFLKFGLALYLAQLAADYRKSGGFRNKNLNVGGAVSNLVERGKKDGGRGILEGVLGNSAGSFWLKYAVVVGLSLFFVVVVQKDLGSGVPIAMEALAILWVAGVPKKLFFLIMAVILVGTVGLILSSPHRRERLATYFGGGESSSESAENGSEETTSDSYHIENALIAIGSGGMLGVGIGNSVQATGYLPESINDSVFAIMGETFGFVGLVIVLMVFFVLLMRVLKVSDYSMDQEMSLVAVGAFAWLTTHVIVNIMAMTGLVPLTGITLPLLSYGGTSMACVAGMLGLVMQLSGYAGRRVILDKERGPEQVYSYSSALDGRRYAQNVRRRRG